MLITEGDDGNSDFFRFAEIYNPTASAFTVASDMLVGRSNHTTTLLRDGRVLIVGGLGDKLVSIVSAEVYDPVSREFAAAGSMNVSRSHHTATLLADGRVTIVGGFGAIGAVGSVELFDPRSGDFVEIGQLAVHRANHTTTLLDGGLLMIAGGTALSIETVGEKAVGEIELLSVDNKQSRIISQKTIPRATHSSSLLPDGRVLLAGGIGPGDAVVGLAQIFDPPDEGVVMTDIMSVARTFHIATSLSDGRVLVAGGVAAGNVILSTSEFFEYLEPEPDIPAKSPASEPVPTAVAPVPSTPTVLHTPETSTAQGGGACSASAGGVALGHIAAFMIPVGLVTMQRVRRRR